MSDTANAVDHQKVRDLVERAVTAAVPAGEMVERKLRPESTFGVWEPRPLAGLQAALLVAQAATDRAYRFARDLRGEGRSWAQIADLLGVPWSEDYSRPERAYELVGGAGGNRRGVYAEPRVYWTCGGPGGCGKYITDRGPYNGYPEDCEDGHDGGCARLAAENQAYVAERDEQERRADVMDEAMRQVVETYGKDSFSAETVGRARYVRSHGGRYLGWSTSESLAVALILDDDEQLEAEGYSTKPAALARVLQGMNRSPQDAQGWLRLLRAAATGER